MTMQFTQGGMGGMAPGGGGGYQFMQSIFAGPVNQHGVATASTAMYFDPEQELVWIGNERGYISSYLGNSLNKYTAFKCHDEAVRGIVVCNQRLVTVGGENVRIGPKQGMASTMIDPGLGELQCLALQKPKGRGNCVLVGGTAPRIVVIDVVQERVVLQVQFPSDVGPAFLKQTSRHLCCCTDAGHVLTLDPKTLKLQTTLASANPDHAIMDMDVGNSLLVTCGMQFSTRAQQMVPDKFVKVYNLRYNSASQPIQISSGPTLLKFMPTMMLSAGKLLVVTLHNQFMMVDAAGTGQATEGHTQVGTPPGYVASTLAVSETGDTIIVGDGSGALHQYSTREDATFNKASYETALETPRKAAAPINLMDMSQSLAFVGGFDPAPNQMLSSDFDRGIRDQLIIRPKPMINPVVVQNMRHRGFIGHASNTVGLKANRIPYPQAAVKLKTPRSMKGGSTVTPAFIRSRKSKDGETSPMKREGDLEGLSAIVPKEYQKVDIKYSYLGVDDFNFGYYNRTNFCGLEIHIPNAYCNAMLQVFYFIGPIRKLAHRHECNSEFCLVCELGFLFHNLDQVPGTNCQATNFLRAFRQVQQAKGLGLVLNEDEAEPPAATMQGLLQSWNRFMLSQITTIIRTGLADSMGGLKVSEGRGGKGRGKGSKKEKAAAAAAAAAAKDKEDKVDVTAFLGCKVLVKEMCFACKNTTTRDDIAQAFELESPESLSAPGLHAYEFRDFLKESICRERHPKAWCKVCNDYKTTQVKRQLRELPHLLPLNCNTDKDKEREFWHRKQMTCRSEEAPPGPETPWLPHQIRLKINKETGDLQVEQTLAQVEAEPLEETEDSCVYDLMATVNHIRDAATSGNFVAHIRVSEIYNKLKEGITATSWYLFNDFAVKRIDSDKVNEKVVVYNMTYNVPISLFYIRRGTNERFSITPEVPHNMQVLERRLLEDRSIAKGQFQFPPTFQQLQSRDEIPGEGDVVALDAEFVSIAKEEAEIRSGQHKKATLKPAHMACARISAVFGSGPRKGQVLFDDYINTPEPVVDYLTKFSGIQPGDLDPGISTKHLTTLKNSYSKLRLLELRGVKFCGHGLSKDFRVINIAPTKDQVVDTVDIYNIRGKRKISLKFLAWFVLRVRMQQSALGHDSIEDSVTALNLYTKFMEVRGGEDKSAWNSLLQTIYDEGQKVGFKVAD